MHSENTAMKRKLSNCKAIHTFTPLGLLKPVCFSNFNTSFHKMCVKVLSPLLSAVL